MHWTELKEEIHESIPIRKRPILPHTGMDHRYWENWNSGPQEDRHTERLNLKNWVKRLPGTLRYTRTMQMWSCSLSEVRKGRRISGKKNRKLPMEKKNLKVICGLIDFGKRNCRGIGICAFRYHQQNWLTQSVPGAYAACSELQPLYFPTGNDIVATTNGIL